MLPGPGLGVVIGEETGDGGGDGPGLARGAQAHIDLVENAFRCGRGERVDEALGQLGEVLAGFQRPFAGRWTGPWCDVIEEDEIEVRGDRHLSAAELAHGQDGEAGLVDMSVPTGEVVGDGPDQSAQDAVGDVAQGEAGFVDIERRSQDVHPNLKLAIVGPAT